MAAPSVATYNSNGRVQTGRTGFRAGIYANLAFRAYHQGDGPVLLSGGSLGWLMSVSGLKIKQVTYGWCLTFADYPTGWITHWYDGTWHSDDAQVQASMDAYALGNYWQPNDPGSPFYHAWELRPYVYVDYHAAPFSAAKSWIWFGDGLPVEMVWGAAGWFLIPGNWDQTAELTFECSCPAVEVVEIEQVGATNWDYPDGACSGIGSTQATFNWSADLAGYSPGDLIADVHSVNGDGCPGYADDFLGSDFPEEQEGVPVITASGWGAGATYPMVWGWGHLTSVNVDHAIEQNTSFNTHINNGSWYPGWVGAVPILMNQFSIGTSAMDLRLPSDVAEYWAAYTETDEQWGTGVHHHNINASGSMFSVYSSGTADGYSGPDCTVDWYKLPMVYQFQGSTTYMDGSVPTVEPRYEEISGGTKDASWKGNTGPVTVYSGTWLLSMTNPSAESSVWGPTITDYVAESSVQWTREEEDPPGAFSLKLVNPEAFNAVSDDHRVLLTYPRVANVLTHDVADVTIDGIADISGTGDGMGGWTGVNCTLAVVGGKLQATVTGAGAYIYRADFYDINHDYGGGQTYPDDDLWWPKRWPPHRFAKLLVDVTEAGSPIDFEGELRVIRTHPSASGYPALGAAGYTLTRTFSHFKLISGGARFDTCKPESAGTTDVQQSYIDQCTPVESVELGSGATKHTVFTERNPSAMWGLGAFDRIEIGGLKNGAVYLFDVLQGVWYTPGEPDEGKYLIISPFEYSPPSESDWDSEAMRRAMVNRPRFDGGSAYLGSGDDYIEQRHRYDRMAQLDVNGHVGQEYPGRYRVILPSGTYIDYNYTVQQVLMLLENAWPADDWSAVAFSLASGMTLFDPGWWDAGLERYTNEKTLFAPDVVPMSWLVPGRILPGGVIQVKPVYDTVNMHRWYGDGVGALRPGLTIISFRTILRARLHGIQWHGDNTPDDEGETHFHTVYESDYTEDRPTDLYGYSFSGHHRSPAYVIWDPPLECSPVLNRSMFRVCGGGLKLGAAMGMVNSMRTGRTYLVYQHPANAETLRIFDHHHARYTERAIGVTMTSGGGIAVREDRADALRIVYEDAGGDINIIESVDEGKNWSAAVSAIATGTFPQIAYNPKDAVEMVAYIAGGYACVRRKLGTAAYGDEIQVATVAADSMAALTPIVDSREGLWALICKDSVTSELNRYVSRNSGRTWALEG